jgi:serine/threonine-protein kinase
MKNDGADSPLPAVAVPVSVAAPGQKAPEAEDSVTLAQPADEAPMPPRPPMPHARIRPTASFPRVSITSVPAQRPRPSMTAIPVVSPFPVQADENSDDAVTRHRESLETLREVETIRADTPAVGKLDVAPPSSAATPKPTPKPNSRPGSEPRTSAMHDAPSATSLVQGDVIGGLCRIDERLAISEMSVLYRAFHLQLERMVVVKVLQDAGVENLEAVARFKREARLMSLVTSEHVAKVLDVGSHEGCPFIVMERLEGADLAYLLKQVGGRLSLRQACDLVLQICEALAVAHSYGIVHRDLKPANVFVSVRAGGDLRVTIIDFGIAKAFFQNDDAEDQLTKVNGLLGSPRYMAPEQVEPRMEVDERADIWALGILFQEMLTGERVFAADGIVPLLIAIVESAPVPIRNFLPDAPDAVVATIAGALEKDPTRRLPNALTFAARVAPFASPDAIQRVANIAAIAAAAAERAADSRPASSERVTLPPKPAPSVPRPLPSVVSLSPGPAAPPASSNPPPTKRLSRELVELDQATAVSPRPQGVLRQPPLNLAPPLVPPVPPPAWLAAPAAPAAPTAPAARLAAPAVAETPPESAAVFAAPVAPVAAIDGTLDAEDTATAAAMRRSPLRSPMVLAAAGIGVAALAFGAVMLGRSAPSDASSAGAAQAAASATTTAPVPVPSAAETAPMAATTAVATAEAATAPSASASSTAEPATVEATDTKPAPSATAAALARPPVAEAGLPVVATRPLPSASAAAAKLAAPTGTGKLTVVCLPKCDQILDNGAVIGNGYVFGQDVPAGHHTLLLSTPAGVKKTVAVDVPADAVKDVRVSMDK